MCPGSGGSDFSGAGQQSPGSRKGGPRSGCSGVPRTGTAGPREWEQRVPGTGATGPESGAATHGAVHGHFLPCTGMYRDRVRAYNVQYTTCTQKVVHFRECTGHVRDWTRFVCSDPRCLVEAMFTAVTRDSFPAWGRDGGVGTVIEFDFLGGKTQEELVQKDEDTKTWAIAMLGSNPLFTTYLATVKVNDDTSETAKVTMRITGIVALQDFDKRRAHIAFTKYMLRNRINEVLCLIADKDNHVLKFEIEVDCPMNKLWDAVNDWAGYAWVMNATGVEVVADQQNYDLRRKVFFGPRFMEERLVLGTENPNSLEYEYGRNDNMGVLHYRGKVEVQKISDKKTKANYTATFLPQPGKDPKPGIKANMDTRLGWIKETFAETGTWWCRVL
ncbi:hypothetical protein Bbelb_415760 [Branchiostoma belcheri]|nr:hypothetical protein Bbelb_415760 [Branchiostoma belcheri]